MLKDQKVEKIIHVDRRKIINNIWMKLEQDMVQSERILIELRMHKNIRKDFHNYTYWYSQFWKY